MTTTAISAPISTATVELLDRSRAGLLTATTAERAGERYIAAHLSALRAAAAVLATRGRADRRAALEAGRVEVIPVREADDQLRAAETFVQLVESTLGLDLGDRLSRLPLPGLCPVLSSS
jgi:SAV_6107-like HEPN